MTVRYKILILNHISSHCMVWFKDLERIYLPKREAKLKGPFRDQAELFNTRNVVLGGPYGYDKAMIRFSMKGKN